MRQIAFELLRHGPPHNQLLSPLTSYLALCENHAAVTIHVPFEHNQFLHRLRALSYELGEDSRNFQFRDTATVLGCMLGEVPGLIAELNRDSPTRRDDPLRAEGQRLTHLRVIISASELALLPFELALCPNGFPGAGQFLLLQSQEPICVTREVRRVVEQSFDWPRAPRVLFVVAQPGDLPQVPFEPHRKALQDLLEPWVGYYDDPKEEKERLAEHLVVLENATAVSLERACANGEFSHIHFLAHGLRYDEGFDVRFGIALHDSRNPTEVDIVSGERLATTLRAAQAAGGVGLARPLVVTLASCYGAQVGTVVGTGASIAHALHEAGIPIVIASQFPISFLGSNLFVQVLYEGLLWGEDPRLSLTDLRRRLHSQQVPGTTAPEEGGAELSVHDWASVTAYASLPTQFNRTLAHIQIEQTMRSIDVAMNYADRATAKLMRPKSGQSAQQASSATDPQNAELLERAQKKIDAGRLRLERLLERARDQRALLCGLLASTEKRCAEVYFSFSRVTTSRAEIDNRKQYSKLLERARRHYWDAFVLDRASSWAVVQFLSLDLLLRRWKGPEPPDLTADHHDEHNRPEALWSLAHVLSLNDVRTRDARTVKWAFANLLELYLIALLLPPNAVGLTPDELTRRAVQRARDLVDHVGMDSFEFYSTRRQILRYDDWYWEIASIEALGNAVEQVLVVLPPMRREPGD